MINQNILLIILGIWLICFITYVWFLMKSMKAEKEINKPDLFEGNNYEK